VQITDACWDTAHLAELAHHVFEDVAGDIVEEGLQTWQVGALLQNALQSLLTLKGTRGAIKSWKPFHFLSFFLPSDL